MVRYSYYVVPYPCTYLGTCCSAVVGIMRCRQHFASFQITQVVVVERMIAEYKCTTSDLMPDCVSTLKMYVVVVEVDVKGWWRRRLPRLKHAACHPKRTD